jgi:hypothetical protein
VCDGETGVQILFQHAHAPDADAPLPLPSHVHYIVHMSSWRIETPLAAELRQKVCSCRVQPEPNGLTVARGRLNLHDVIGLRSSPDGTLWNDAPHWQPRKVPSSSGVASGGGSPRSVLTAPVVPSLVVHVPSNLNPAFLDATITFGPRTLNWLHGGHGRSAARGPRVIVSLHPQPQPRPPLSPCAGLPPTPRATSAPASARAAPVVYRRLPRQWSEVTTMSALTNATNATTTTISQWSEGTLPFPMHSETSRERRPRDGWRWRSMTSQPSTPPPRPVQLGTVPRTYEYDPQCMHAHYATAVGGSRHGGASAELHALHAEPGAAESNRESHRDELSSDGSATASHADGHAHTDSSRTEFDEALAEVRAFFDLADAFCDLGRKAEAVGD